MKGFIKGFLKGMHEFGLTIGVIINSILLGITYYIGIGISKIIIKLSGKNLLDLKFNKKSYWKPVKHNENNYRQF
jgi:hypothetical protein